MSLLRSVYLAITFGVLLVSAQVVAAAQAAGPQGADSSRAYRNLFQPGELKLTPPIPATAPKIVCGTTMIPADPGLDPKIRVAPPRDRQHTLRVIPPPPCR